MSKFSKSTRTTDANPASEPLADAPESMDTSASQPASAPVDAPVSGDSGQSAASSAAEPSSTPTDAHIAKLQQTITELTNDLQRTRADFENFRKQTELQKAQGMNITKQTTVAKFLPLIDDFERALTSYPDQLAPLQKSFAKTLKSLGLSQIDSQPGVAFDPDFHEAVSVEGDGDTEVIAETLRPGYLYDGEVIRAAMVKVQNS